MIKIFNITIWLQLSYALCAAQTPIENSGIIFLKSATDTFYISGNFTNKTSGAVTVKGFLKLKGNTSILTGSSVTVDTTGVIQLGNALSNAGTFIVAAGTVEMTGTLSQTLPVGSFTNNAVNNFIISNTNASGVAMNGAIDVYGSLTYSSGGTSLNTGDSLTFKSSAAQTAWIGNMTGKTISGKAIVERFISSKKAWRLLSVPTNTTQSVKNGWQENATSSAQNPKPGYGTQVTDRLATWAANGFDFQSPGGPSVKKFNPATGIYDGIPSAYSSLITSEGYMVYVRGDRTVTATGNATQTVLRTTGPLFTGDRPPVSVRADTFMCIGNPYASRIDCRSITKTGVRDFFYVWDPALGGTFGMGAFQVFSNNGSGNYVVTPGGGSYSASGSISNFIESGQAFFVQGAASGGSVTFKEDAKGSGSSLTSFIQTLPQASLSLNLLGINTDGTGYTTDGLLINFDAANSDSADQYDAVKMINTKENISVQKGAILLTVERRGPVAIGDTVFLKLANTAIQNYRFDFMAQQFSSPGIVAQLQDTYLNNLTPVSLNGATSVNFSVTADAASYVPNRFRIIFSQSTVLSFSFTNLEAHRKKSRILVNWKTADEQLINYYTAEASVDGSRFWVIDTAKARNLYVAAYTAIHADAPTGKMFYRIGSRDVNGQLKYSNIVSVASEEAGASVSVFPNPVKDRVLHIQIADMPAALIKIALINAAGQKVFNANIEHIGQTATYPVILSEAVTPGAYILQTHKKDMHSESLKVTIL